MIISHEHRFIFIHIHKTAGESITAALLPSLDRQDVVVANRRIRGARPSWKGPRSTYANLGKHSTAAEVQAAVPEGLWSSYYKFAVVREPIDRVLSLYSYLGGVARRRQQPRPEHLLYHVPFVSRRDPKRWWDMKAYLASTSLSEFLRRPELMQSKAMRPQHECVADETGNLLVDYVARFERLDSDLAEIFRAVGVPTGQLRLVNQSERTPRAQELSGADLSRLVELFEADYRTFGYPLPE